MQNENFKMKGSFIGTLKKSNGDIQVTRKDNMILDVGFDFISNAIGNNANRPAVMGYTAVGSGSDDVSAENTALTQELPDGRKAATYNHIAGTKEFTLTTDFKAGEATGAITEAGIVNASSGGIFLDRVVFNVINKGENDELTTTFRFTLS